MSKKKEFPNNWEAISEAPSEYFDSIPFDDFMSWKIAGWDIPSSISCIIRATHLKTKKVTEYVYSSKSAARKRVMSMMDNGEYEFYICDEDTIHYLYPGEDDEDAE